VLATVVGFVLAALIDVYVLFPVASLTFQWPAQSQGDFAFHEDVRIGLGFVGIALVAALRAAFQAVLLQRRLRLGVAWIAAMAVAALGARVLLIQVAPYLPRPGPVVLNHLNVISFAAVTPGLITGLAAWLVLIRLARAPLLFVAGAIAAVIAPVVGFETARQFINGPFDQSLIAQQVGTGLVWGVIEGVALAWVLAGKPKQEADRPAVTLPA
jgi:hypothetical protein